MTDCLRYLSNLGAAPASSAGLALQPRIDSFAGFQRCRLIPSIPVLSMTAAAVNFFFLLFLLSPPRLRYTDTKRAAKYKSSRIQSALSGIVSGSVADLSLPPKTPRPVGDAVGVADDVTLAEDAAAGSDGASEGSAGSAEAQLLPRPAATQPSSSKRKRTQRGDEKRRTRPRCID